MHNLAICVCATDKLRNNSTVHKCIIGTATAYRSSLQYHHLTWWRSEGCPLLEAHPKVVAWPLSWRASHAGLRSCLSLLLQPVREIINFKLDSHHGKSCAQREKGKFYETCICPFRLFIARCDWSITWLEIQEPHCAMNIYKKLLVDSWHIMFLDLDWSSAWSNLQNIWNPETAAKMHSTSTSTAFGDQNTFHVFSSSPLTVSTIIGTLEASQQNLLFFCWSPITTAFQGMEQKGKNHNRLAYVQGKRSYGSHSSHQVE